MAYKLFERLYVLTDTTGTGSLNCVAAVSPAFNMPGDLAAVSTDTSTFILEEGNDYEIFLGTITIAGGVTTVARTTTLESKVSGVIGTSHMNLLGNATLRCGACAHDTLIGPAAAITDGYLTLWDGNNRKLKQGSGAPGSAALKNTGTSGNTVPLLDAKNAFSKPQCQTPSALTTATSWDGSAVNNLTVDVNGANFAVANPSVLPDSGVYVAVDVKFTTTHNLTFGNLFLGLTPVVPSNLTGKYDFYLFRSNGTNLKLVGYRLDTAT